MLTNMETQHSSRWARVTVLVALAILAYAPALRLPFIADDFVQIPLAHRYAAAGWVPLWHDHFLLTRTTYMLLSSRLVDLFGFTPAPFYAASILLHVACVLCVFAMSTWSEVGRNGAFFAASFFAVFEGHNEAVMWAAASSDLLVFLFGSISWILWVKWLENKAWQWYAGSFLAFLAAAASKESFWIFPALLILPVVAGCGLTKRAVIGLVPLSLISLGFVLWNFADRVSAPGYSDIRFSLKAPWLEVLVNSTFRLLFIWGFVAVLILLVFRHARDLRRMLVWLLWILISIFPCSFLTYMLWVPSRHTYVASAGLAMLVGLAAQRLLEARKVLTFWVLSFSALVTNIEILWVKKMAQFEERAEPSELLAGAARGSAGPIYIDCVPLPRVVVSAVLSNYGKAAVYREEPCDEPHCFKISYTDASGKLVKVERRLGTVKHTTFY